MTFVHQEVWGWQIATYLFLGGLGGATFAIGAILHLFEGCDRKMLSIAVLSSIGFLVLGTVFLLADMLQPLKAAYALTNPKSWIFWGVVFINFYFLAAIVYVIPLLEEWPKLLPIIKKIPAGFLGLLERFNRLAALGGSAAGFLITIYTGLLISAAPAISFWNTPALPLLFVFSGFSTGAAYLLLLSTISKQEASWKVTEKLEQLDAILIVSELIVLGAYFNFALFLPTGARESAEYLFHSPLFIVGFFIAGLVVPLVVETYGIFFASHSNKSKSLLMLASTLVLVGGYLLRLYVLNAGLYQYPW
ncbi:NrfD/PsrC family molybdoenzyme membrane anchor subunit [Pelodictyon phaeoclathratiforme]|jgi:formate-dependent nitrite reductase membrane component NrfD|uniref:Polysulphide reductase NrfD n=1 Tax=Pelodictyon phaeoclathratiforme (strain DSM 5477 / BU-1) TaxID=324925 RepID=B4SHD4_PELPB|nr:NrfD/PsrC family molybdoenzyme membrane anchor subunit [Pelodictyon phaeoclathratiforme]ACF43601.1 Polysulphide reductase NrfD [Pelodictyon phaeoclathratiforme BU-1]MBV5289100.1 polysulfide reductase NrfD [Pelodictyon phaeoclathratiforme]